jgi:hypothetical protein
MANTHKGKATEAENTEDSSQETDPNSLDIEKLYKQPNPYNPGPQNTETTLKFINYVLELYREDEHTNDDLTEVFQMDFAMFTKKDWLLLGNSKLMKLRAELRKKGFYIPIKTGRDVSEAFESAVKDSLEWPLADPLCPEHIKEQYYAKRERSDKLFEDNSTHNHPQHASTASNPDIPDHGSNKLPHAHEYREKGTHLRSQTTPAPSAPENMLWVPKLAPYIPIPTIPPNSAAPQTETRLPTAAEMVIAAQSKRNAPDTTIITLTKMYVPKDKYSGSPDESFLDKFSTFMDLTQRAGVTHERLSTAFPVMLKERALDYYRQTCQKLDDILTLVAHFEAHFENMDHRLQKLDEWHSITLSGELQKSENAGSLKSDIFNAMINRLRQIQHSLPHEMRTESILHQKILSAIRDLPEYTSIASIGHTEVNRLVNAITVILGRSTTTKTQEAYFVDRKMHHSDHKNAYSHNHNNYGSPRYPYRHKTCYICKKEGCWSTKHTKTERETFLRRMAARKERQDAVAYMMAQDLSDELAGSLSDEIDKEMAEYYFEFSENEEEDNHTLKIEHFFTTTSGPILPKTAKQYLQELANDSVKHIITGYTDDISASMLDTYRTSAIFLSENERHRWNNHTFQGILLDTGAQGASTAGFAQAEAYIKEYGGQINKSRAGEVHVQFGIGTAISIGTLDVQMPIGEATFHIINTSPPTPFLMTIDGMDTARVYLNNLDNEILHQDGRKWRVVRRYGHPFLAWGKAGMAYLTETELRQLHRRFGHPSVNRLIKTLEKAGYDDKDHRGLLGKIADFCHQCQTHGKAPGRFKFTLKDDPVFNHTIMVDIMYLEGNMPVLHVVDEATNFQAARFLDNVSAEHTWDALRLCWIDVYLGPPDVIKHDAGKNFKSALFRQNANTLSIATTAVPIEAAHSIGLVERYHAPLRRAYDIISDELHSNVPRSTRLQMAVKAVNDTAGYDGLIPTLLVFGAFPRISDADPPSLTTTQRAAAIKAAMSEVGKLYAKRQISDALRMRNGPQMDRVRELPIGSEVLVWRIHEKEWTGPFKLLGINNETCLIDTGKKNPLEFRITTIKPYKRNTELSRVVEEETEQEMEPITTKEVSQNATNLPLPQITISMPEEPILVKRGRGRPRKYPHGAEKDTNTNSQTSPGKRSRGRPRKHLLLEETYAATAISGPPPNFTESRRKEINGLIESGVFSIAEDIPAGIRVFGSRFVDIIKYPGTEKAFEKSRLVVQGYNDSGKHEILTQAPTIQRSSQRIILCALMTRKDVNAYTRDISQAYTQSITRLQRKIFIQAPKELNLAPGTVLQVNRPLYGIPEAGNHWFLTYQTHHIEQLGLTVSTFDPCLLYRENAVVGLQTDDSLIVATPEFINIEEQAIKKAKFRCKPIERLDQDHPLEFNGFIATITGSGIQITQEKQASCIRLLDKNFTKAEYIRQRALGAYLATVSQPEASFALSYAAQVTEPNWNDAQFLNRCLQHQIATKGINFVQLDEMSLRLIVYTDSSFANNRDHSSQIGYIVVLSDKDGNANLIQWQSVKCRRVTRSVLAAELYALSLGFDVSATIRTTLNHLFAGERQEGTNKAYKVPKIPLTLCIDSKSLYDCLIKLGTTQEKRLMIDILCLRQSYERREITEILWIKGEKNPADAMTKEKPCDALRRLITTNKVDLSELNGWVDRETKQ